MDFPEFPVPWPGFGLRGGCEIPVGHCSAQA
jgi:hypothetical protein